MAMELNYINENNKYKTIRQLLVQEFDISNRLILKLKKFNKIKLNNESTFLDRALQINDVVKIDLDFEEDNSNIVPTSMNLEILFEDESMLIINKPSGVPIHPSMDHFSDSLSNGVKFYFDKLNVHKKIRPVNRLDRNTSGIVIFAKNEYVQECLIRQMKNELFLKEYIAFCVGYFNVKSGLLSYPIARKPNSIIERCVDENGQEAITKYIVLDEQNGISKVKIQLLTGRTHQIRVHMAHIGHPLLGDDLYGTTSTLIDRQALHACKINFIHPLSQKEISIISPLPEDMKKCFLTKTAKYGKIALCSNEDV